MYIIKFLKKNSTTTFIVIFVISLFLIFYFKLPVFRFSTWNILKEMDSLQKRVEQLENLIKKDKEI
jgi:hypothetical protein